MSFAAIVENPAPGKPAPAAPRKAQVKRKRAKRSDIGKSRKPAPLSSAPGIATIRPTPARATAMAARAIAPKIAGDGEQHPLAVGLAQTLLTAGSKWSAEQAKAFQSAVAAALPVICGYPAPIAA